jgi:VCBS repeat-containing protein
MHYLNTTATVYGPVTEALTAADLSSNHVDRLVHFAYTEETTALEILVIGELREVVHHVVIDSYGTDHAVTVWVTGRNNTTGDKREFQLAPTDVIVLVQD